MSPFQIRPATREDHAFIYSTWLRSFRYNSDFAKPISKDIYYNYHQKLIERIINRATCGVFIAHENSDPSVILGYIVLEGPVLHFAYVKKPFRGFGVFSGLHAACASVEKIEFVSHLTKCSKKFVEQNPNIKYNPYLT